MTRPVTRPSSVATFVTVLSALVLFAAAPARAASAEQEIVDKARLTAEKLISEKAYGTMVNMMKDAKGVLIIPSLLKGAFIFGAEGGSGVLLARTESGGWSYPAFYTMGGASVGFQVGAQASEVVLLIMNEGALSAVMKNQIKLGGDVSAWGYAGALDQAQALSLRALSQGTEAWSVMRAQLSAVTLADKGFAPCEGQLSLFPSRPRPCWRGWRSR